MKRVKRILLDLDGPLLDGKQRHYHCYRTILEIRGFKPIAIEEYWAGKRALVDRRILLNMSGAGAIYDDFLAAWLSAIETPALLALDTVQDGAVECLRGWKGRGIELVLVTMRKNRHGLEDQLNLTGLRAHLDSVLVSDHAEGGEGKAQAVREFYLAHPDGGYADETLWVGDTEADWGAARSLGCDVVLVANGLRNAAYLQSLKSVRVEPSIASLKDVTIEKAGKLHGD
jgi:phosphoglycolate phosphatase